MNKLKTIGYLIKYCLWGSLLGFLILFFMPESKLAFNWQSFQGAWHFYQSYSKSANSINDKPLTIENISFADSVNKASPSVVSITVLRERLIEDDNLESDEKIFERGLGVGSGIILNEQGYIVTNYHVIDKSNKIIVNLIDGRKQVVDLVGFDIETDIAVLKADFNNIKPAIFATESNTQVGDIILAIGNPFGGKQSVSLGVISALDVLSSNPFLPLLQTDAVFNNGNSGGALINLRGEVVGINQKIVSSPGGGQLGISYSIPISLVKKIIDEIITYGHVKRNYLGIGVFEYSTEFIHKKYFPNIEYGTGFFVLKVDLGSPSYIAGIKPKDFITAFDGKKIDGVASFYKLFYAAPLGNQINLTLIRDGKKLNINVKLTEQPH